MVVTHGHHNKTKCKLEISFKIKRIPNGHLVYLAKQLFGKPQRKNVCKFCPNISSKGEYCGAPLNSRDLHIRTCKMTPIHHQKHAAVQHWFDELAKQAHIATTPAPPIYETNLQNPTKPLAADLLLIDVSLLKSLVEMVRLWLSIIV